MSEVSAATRPAGAPALRRVGHKGADLIAPGNTVASFDAALHAGVDMIEFDVLPERGGDRLLLAHDYEDAARRASRTRSRRAWITSPRSRSTESSWISISSFRDTSCGCCRRCGSAGCWSGH